MSCKNAYFAGFGTCKNLLKKMSGLVLQTKGATWTDATVIAAASWHTAIADDDSAVRSALPFNILNFENTTDEMEILTSALGHKFKGSDPVPSGMVSLKIGLQDYLWLLSHDGQEYEFFPFFQNVLNKIGVFINLVRWGFTFCIQRDGQASPCHVCNGANIVST